MPRNSTAREFLRQLTATGSDAETQQRKERLLHALQEQSPDVLLLVAQGLTQKVTDLNANFETASAELGKLSEVLDKMSAPPWPVAVFRAAIPEEGQALVSCQGGMRMVHLADGVDPESFSIGDDVFLNVESNLLLAKAPWESAPVGRTAEFQRYVGEGRLLINSSEDTHVVEAAGTLRDITLEEGDLVRWKPELHLAFEKIERDISHRHLLTDIPDTDESQIGGQRSAFKAISASLIATLVDPDKASDYQVSRSPTILMVGPPGCGKTLMARAAAANTMSLSGKKCHFAVVKPAEWESPLVGTTEANIRNCFESLKKLADEGDQVVLFLDEVESVGRIRGHVMGYHGDKFVAALLAELDGFTQRGGVAIIAATNRKDLIDPALLERLSDVEIQVPRPNRRAAEEIFQIHLAESVPFSPNGQSAAATRTELIDSALARFYSPNADNDLCVAKFRDGSERVVSAHELISGRLIEQFCRAVRQRAFIRDMENNDRGVRLADVEETLSDTIERLSTTLSPRNIRSYLSDLPQDVDVISVKPVVRQTRRAHRYVHHPGRQ